MRDSQVMNSTKKSDIENSQKKPLSDQNDAPAPSFPEGEPCCVCTTLLETGQSFFQCHSCSFWFHLGCTQVSDSEAPYIQLFNCILCCGFDKSLEIVYKEGYNMKQSDTEEEESGEEETETQTYYEMSKCGKCDNCEKKRACEDEVIVEKVGVVKRKKKTNKPTFNPYDSDDEVCMNPRVKVEEELSVREALSQSGLLMTNKTQEGGEMNAVENHGPCDDPKCPLLIAHAKNRCEDYPYIVSLMQQHSQLSGSENKGDRRELGTEEKAEKLYKEGLDRLSEEMDKISKFINLFKFMESTETCGSPLWGMYPGYEFLFSKRVNLYKHGECLAVGVECKGHIGWQKKTLKFLEGCYDMMDRAHSSLQLHGPIIIPNKDKVDSDEAKMVGEGG